jgi:hypothetical protein
LVPERGAERPPVSRPTSPAPERCRSALASKDGKVWIEFRKEVL